MPESLRRMYERYFLEEDGTPNFGLVIASLIVVFVVLGVVWQVAYGRSASEEQSGRAAPEQNAQEEDVSASSGGSSAGTSGDEGMSAVCGTFVEQQGADISAEQRDAAEKTVGEFVAAAYGYTGTDADFYSASVEELTVEGCFSDSITAQEVESAAEVARQGGEENAPSDRNFLEEFVGFYVTGEEKISNDSGEYLVLYGDAVWVSRKARAEPSDREALTGFQESITVAKEAGGDSGWKVVEGQGPTFYPDTSYEYAIDEEIDEITSRSVRGGETTGPESTEGLMEETTAPATSSMNGLTNSG